MHSIIPTRSANRIVRNFLLVSAMALAVPAPGMADDHSLESERAEHRHEHNGGKAGHKRGERMFDKLGLSDEQRVQAHELMKAHHAKMLAERKAFMQQMDQILTPEQREKAREMRRRHHEKRDNSDKRGED